MKKKTLYIVDIFSFIFRAYYAIRPLHAIDGTQVNAVYGVVSMLHKLIKSKQPDHLVVAMDSKGKGFRNEIFPEYKANRAEPPEDLPHQIELIEEFIKTYPLKTLSVSGYEADDVIATLVHKYCHKKDIDVYIVSPDKDLMQLVCENVFLYDTMKEKIMGPKDVVEKFGVPPEKVIDVQSLCGDPTDNIPGVAGVGPKTASKLINDFGSLDGVYEHLDQIKGKLKDKLIESKDKAYLSRKLVSLTTDIALDVEYDDLEMPKIDQKSLNEFYKKLNFRTLVEEKTNSISENSSAKQTQSQKANFITITDTDHLKEILKAFKKEKSRLFVFDTETDSLNSMRANLVGISFCTESDKAYYIPLAHKEEKNLSLDDVREILSPIFQSQDVHKVAQNAKYDLNVLSHHGFEINGLFDDTMIASYLISPEGSHGLDSLALKYLHHTMLRFKDIVKKGQNFSDVDIATATRYAAEDAWATHEILPHLYQELDECNLNRVYHELEVPLVSILARMEQHGVLVDQKLLQQLHQEFEKRLQKLEKKVCELAECEFNLNSPKQLQEILFEKLKLPVIKKTKTGNSTDVEVLTALSTMHDLPKHLLEYRTLSKLLSTYVVQLANLIHPETKRIHTSFNQAVVATGRLSSSDPNLQNIPIRGEEGKRIREVFIAPEGSLIFSADYSQIELRLLAHFTQDPKLLEAYNENQDIHKKTAASIFDIPLDHVRSEQRNIGKTINFGVVYGQSSFGLSQLLKLPQTEARHFIEKFYKEFKRVRVYKDEVLDKARQDGFVSTYLGRRRYLPELNSRNKLAQRNAERAAFNAIFQGSAADLIKKAMIEVDAWLTKEKLKTKMILQVHDELIFEVPEKELPTIKKHIPDMMAGVFTLDVPLVVSFDSGKNWGEAH